MEQLRVAEACFAQERLLAISVCNGVRRERDAQGGGEARRREDLISLTSPPPRLPVSLSGPIQSRSG
jgi:hypothetical protein